MFQEGNSSAVVLSIVSRNEDIYQNVQWAAEKWMATASEINIWEHNICTSFFPQLLCNRNFRWSSCSVSITGSDFFFLIQFTFIISPFPPQLKGVKHGFINEILMYIKATSGTCSLQGLGCFGLKIDRTAATCGNQSPAQKITNIPF